MCCKYLFLTALLIAFCLTPTTTNAAPEKNKTPVTEEIEDAGELKIISRPINYDKERIQMMLDYRRQHQDPDATNIVIEPKMIILHWTGIPTFEASWNCFNRKRADAGREHLANAGEANVSIQFLVDRDGSVSRLIPENWMARHCIGLNHVAIGVENVGDGKKLPLTDEQVKANVALVRYLAKKYPITHLIGHSEYRKMEGHPYFLELDPEYRNTKPDPGAAFMRKVREQLKDLKLEGPPDGKK